MSSYWVSKWFCGKNTKQVHKERKQVDLQWFMVVREFCVKKVARSQRAGQQCGAQRADRRGRQLKSSGMMNSNCLVDAAIFHRTGSAKVVADFPRWWNCNIFIFQRKHFKYVAWLLQGMLCCCDLVYGFTVRFTSQLSPHQNVRSDSNWHLSILHFHCTLIFIWLTPGSSFYPWHSNYREGIWAE